MTGDGNLLYLLGGCGSWVILVGCLNRKSLLLGLFWHPDLRGIIQSEIGEKKKETIPVRTIYHV